MALNYNLAALSDCRNDRVELNLALSKTLDSEHTHHSEIGELREE